MDLSNSLLVCLVSRQSMPNVIPAIMYKPAKVILITTAQEISTAENINSLLNEKNIKCEIYPQLIKPYDIEGTEKIADKVIIDTKDYTAVFNSTGGTKLMAFAVYNVFRKYNLKIIYCDTAGNRIIELFPETSFENIDVKISIEEYLRAYGYFLMHAEKNPCNGIELIKYLDENNLINTFITDTNDKRKNNILGLLNNLNHIQLGKFKISKRENLITISHGNKIFPGINKNFLNGFWLEDYLFYKLNVLMPDEIKAGIYISSESKSSLTELQISEIPYNEIDVAAVKNGRLHLFSCKSGVKSKEDLFELEGLRNLAGGTFGQAYSVVTRSTRFYNNRAKSMNIKLIDIREINNFNFS
jgi:hypothetical protein